MLPLLAPGYIQTFDLSWAPHIPAPTHIDNTFLWQFFLHFLSLIVPSQIIEKAILFTILLTSSLSAHYLAKYLLKNDTVWPPFFAGILYMVNPFTYDRFLDGQYLVLIGYALLPIFTLYLWRFIDQPTLRRVVPVILITLLITITSIHSIFFIFLIASVSNIIKIWHPTKNVILNLLSVRIRGQSVRALIQDLSEKSSRMSQAKEIPDLIRNDKSYLLNLTIWSAFFILAVVLASSYWLVPFFQGRSTTAQEIATFDQRQLYTFQTVPDHTYGIPASLNPLTLYGYWGEDQGRFALPKAPDPAWGILFIFILTLAIIGSFTYFQKNRSRVIALISLILFGWVFSVGIASPPFFYLNLWLYQHIHFLQGYREPQKFISLTALGYAILGSLGLAYLLQKTNSWKDETFQTMRLVFIALAIFLPILYTPTILFAFAGQLRSADFPPDWYSVNQLLNSDHSNFQVLFLPWHHYMYFSFAGRVVSNPAPKFFDKSIIASTSDELGLIPSNTETLSTTQVESKILNTDHQNLGDALNQLRIKYIILDKDTDWQDYDWLNSSPDMKLISDGKILKLYQNLKF